MTGIRRIRIGAAVVFAALLGLALTAGVIAVATRGGGRCGGAECDTAVLSGERPAIVLTEPAVATPSPQLADTPTAEPAPRLEPGGPPPASSGGEASASPASAPPSSPPPSAAPTAPPAAPADAGSCGATCGEPRYFCDTWQGGMCNDYRQLGDTTQEIPFPQGGEPVTLDCVSTTNPGYVPGGAQPCAFSKHEHFMTRIEDADFGLVMMRFWQPIDLSAERHIHVDLDLKISVRRYVRFMLTPNLVKRSHDDRGGNLYPGQAIDIWLKAGGPEAFVSRSADGDFFSNSEFCDLADIPGSTKLDDVRQDVDLYVSRSRVRVAVNGVDYGSCSFAAVPFDRAYLYVEQASYNPCKDGECSPNLQVFHWDNTAFDGPALAYNSLTPAGEQDVVFNAYSQASCTVKGYAAVNQGNFRSYNWNTYVARMPVQDVSAADVQCSDGEGGGHWDRIPRGFEVVRQY